MPAYGHGGLAGARMATRWRAGCRPDSCRLEQQVNILLYCNTMDDSRQTLLINLINGSISPLNNAGIREQHILEFCFQMESPTEYCYCANNNSLACALLSDDMINLLITSP
jgi:hypothetical protein